MDDYVNILTKVDRWFQKNSLTLNLNKTNLVHFVAKTTVNIPEYIDLGQNRLFNSQIINFLGLTLEYSLSWCLHIARISNKLRSVLHFKDTKTHINYSKFEDCVLCLFPFNHVLWRYILG